MDATRDGLSPEDGLNSEELFGFEPPEIKPQQVGDSQSFEESSLLYSALSRTSCASSNLHGAPDQGPGFAVEDTSLSFPSEATESSGALQRNTHHSDIESLESTDKLGNTNNEHVSMQYLRDRHTIFYPMPPASVSPSSSNNLLPRYFSGVQSYKSLYMPPAIQYLPSYIAPSMMIYLGPAESAHNPYRALAPQYQPIDVTPSLAWSSSTGKRKISSMQDWVSDLEFHPLSATVPTEHHLVSHASKEILNDPKTSMLFYSSLYLAF
ncbi:uncharacterized protein EV420DRAFT_1753434 [Desarmillaria tabescens]|uniref:Uncharacterized protein n=1 Tax=Armillaria tabescens TaxID=1929756 RepID=A0AA39J7I6_ARMTA|nr:uncharacterized protein EV420DRAFT_1753434 [Desarmillaria tabescens]KAK0437605.1 hypothetical protein EV420DRAFT_1753434 [Desarmillaria tabescens]